jgi:misacylated tRNA(Ala) deacylase
MTEELFRADAMLDECEAVVTAVDERGVQLDRTVFYPHGGGQAGDRGELVLADGRAIAVGDTRKGEQPGDVVHVLASADDLAAFAVGATVTARIDVARRRAHMRFHTATHLLCALIPHPVDGCSITADYSGRVRLLEIEGVDLRPCGGTHVTNTRDIGALMVRKIEKKSATTRRVVLAFKD